MSVIAYFLGKIKYKEAYSLQKQIVKLSLDFSAHRKFNTILLLEHFPVYTVGIRNSDTTTDYSDSYTKHLTSTGADFVKTDRGGLITFHGPGQLVAYPILNLKSEGFKNSSRWYVETLENTIIDTCLSFGLKAKRTNDIGIWVSEHRKIASIGIHKRLSITYHGMALNCDVDLKWFNNIVACGLVGKSMTSLSVELGKRISVRDACENFLKSFENNFGRKVDYIDLSNGDKSEIESLKSENVC